MENLLLHYFDKQFREKESPLRYNKGPLVTISREFGCPSRQIGLQLTEALNRPFVKSGGAVKPPWKIMNKEIIEEAARELKLKLPEMKYVLNAAQKSFFEDVLVSFTKPYVSNIRLKHTLQRIIGNVVSPGHIVLVGMGSAVILQGFPRALHIRLQAPLAWRIDNIRKSRDIPADQALHLVYEMDQSRIRLLEFLLGKKFEYSLFDIIFNCGRLSNEEIVTSILTLMKHRTMN